MIIWNDYKYGEGVYQNKKVSTTRWQYKELRTLVLYMVLNEIAPKDIRTALNECCKDDIKYLKEKQKRYIFDKLANQVKTEIRGKTKDKDKDKKSLSDIIETKKPIYENSKNVTIYKEEVNTIKSINNINLEKLCFVLLVYCKWLGLEWFNIYKSDLFTEAKITNLNSKKQQEQLTELFKMNLVESEVIKVNRKNRRGSKDTKSQMWKLKYLETDGDIAFVITDYLNLVYRYLDFVYGGYFECEECKVITKQTNNKHKYCYACANKIKKMQDKEANTRYKNKLRK